MTRDQLVKLLGTGGRVLTIVASEIADGAEIEDLALLLEAGIRNIPLEPAVQRKLRMVLLGIAALVIP
jgi:hypothetical protein